MIRNFFPISILFRTRSYVPALHCAPQWLSLLVRLKFFFLLNLELGSKDITTALFCRIKYAELLYCFSYMIPFAVTCKDDLYSAFQTNFLFHSQLHHGNYRALHQMVRNLFLSLQWSPYLLLHLFSCVWFQSLQRKVFFFISSAIFPLQWLLQSEAVLRLLLCT